LRGVFQKADGAGTELRIFRLGGLRRCALGKKDSGNK